MVNSIKSPDSRIVCLVIPSLQAGGMERVMSELADYFAKKNDIDIHLIIYGIYREIFYPLDNRIIVHKPLFKFNNSWRFFYTLKTLWYLRSTIKIIRPHCILSFGEYWNNFFLISVLGLKFHTFISDRSQPDKSLGWFHDALRNWLYKKANGLILQTEKAKEIFLQNNYHPNIAVIGNPIKNIDTTKSCVKRERIVLTVGRLIKTKNHDLLIEMFAKVSPPDWKLLIVGYDHLKQHNLDRLKALAKELNVDNRITFIGKIDNVEAMYLRSSVFAFTSSSEGFPNVIGEAMAGGLPVIAFDCVAGPSEMIVDGYNGYLVPLFDKYQFETKLARLMEDERLREKFGQNARKSISKFSSRIICESFESFILN